MVLCKRLHKVFSSLLRIYPNVALANFFTSFHVDIINKWQNNILKAKTIVNYCTVSRLQHDPRPAVPFSCKAQQHKSRGYVNNCSWNPLLVKKVKQMWHTLFIYDLHGTLRRGVCSYSTFLKRDDVLCLIYRKMKRRCAQPVLLFTFLSGPITFAKAKKFSNFWWELFAILSRCFGCKIH